MRKVYSGFTLIELMIVVAIIGIVAGIAYPSYLKQVQKSNRSDAKVLLSDVAQRMQRCFTAQSKYNPDKGGCAVVDQLQGADGILSKEQFYSVKIENDDDLTASTYTLTATPVENSRQEGDEDCATFTLTQAGVRAALNSGGDDNTDECW